MKHYKHKKISYDSIDKIQVAEFPYPITKINNFIFSNIDGHYSDKDIDSYLVPDNAFIMELTGYSHFHFIYDKLAQYEFIKGFIPDLEMYIISRTPEIEKSENNLINILKDIYSIPESNIIEVDTEHEYKFAKRYHIWGMHDETINDIFEPDYFDPQIDPIAFEVYIKAVRKLLHKRFSKWISDPSKANRKIFISNYDRNERIGRDPDDMRYISASDELALEARFKEMGYEIIDSGLIDLTSQIMLYSSASHIASIKSSGLVNIIFCHENTNIISVNLDNKYWVWYDTISEHCNLNYYEFPENAGPFIPDVTMFIRYKISDIFKLLSDSSQLL
jgi:hypothetical protein